MNIKFSKEKGTGEEKSFVDTRTELSSNFKATLITNTTLKRDRLIRLVLGSCPYHGTSHRALSLRRRALPMAVLGNESTPAVA